jgi:hypothetical protein
MNLDLTSIPELVRYAKEGGIHATVVGPRGRSRPGSSMRSATRA